MVSLQQLVTCCRSRGWGHICADQVFASALMDMISQALSASRVHECKQLSHG